MKSDKASPKKVVKKAAPIAGEGAAPAAGRVKKNKTIAAAESGEKPARRTRAAKAPAKTAAPKAVEKSPAGKQTLSVPPILLEGDQPPAPATSGPGQRYALGPAASPARHLGAETPGELPEAYGTRQLLLTARDPHWLYARWDLTRESAKKI